MSKTNTVVNKKTIVDSLINDFVDNRKVFMDLKRDVEKLLRRFQVRNFSIEYNTFCIRILEYVNNTDFPNDEINENMESKDFVKDLLFNSMVMIAVDYLRETGEIMEAESLEKLMDKESSIHRK